MNQLTNSYNSCKNQFNQLMNQNSYLRRVPKNTFDQVFKSLAIGVAVTYVCTEAPKHSVRIGTFCALATAIHGLITPLFRDHFAPNGEIRLSKLQEMGRGSFALASAAAVATLTGYQISSLGKSIAIYAIRILFQDLENLSSANIFFPIFNITA